jgi:hypothetical protein
MDLFWPLVAAVVVAVCAAITGWRTPLVLGLLGSAATVWRASAVMAGIPRLRVVVMGSILTASAVLWSWVDWRLVSVGGFCAALVLYPGLQMVQRRRDDDTRSAQLGRLVRGLVIGVTIALSGLAILGIFERNQASFAMRYGQRVTVTVGQVCTADPVPGGPCPDARWTIDGRTYTGTLFVGSHELPTTAPDIYAYPGEDRAYSARHYSADIDGMELVGFVPPWPFILGVIMMVIVALPARVRNRVRGFGRVD